MKSIARSCVPPILWKYGSRISKGFAPFGKEVSPIGEEQPADYYNQFGSGDHLKKHYTESHYYHTWLVITDHMLKRGAKKILDVGCGPGQFSQLLSDNGFKTLGFNLLAQTSLEVKV